MSCGLCDELRAALAATEGRIDALTARWRAAGGTDAWYWLGDLLHEERLAQMHLGDDLRAHEAAHEAVLEAARIAARRHCGCLDPDCDGNPRLCPTAAADRDERRPRS